MQRYNGHHYVSQKSSGLSILLHGVISLPEGMSCDNQILTFLFINQIIRCGYSKELSQ